MSGDNGVQTQFIRRTEEENGQEGENKRKRLDSLSC